MKKNNSNGFALMETLIVSVFITGICAFLFTNFLPLIGEYDKISDYDTLEGKYAVHQIRKMLLREISEDVKITNVLKYNTTKGYTLYESVSLCNELNYATYCYKLFSPNYLNVKSVIVTGYRLVDIKTNLSSSGLNTSLKDYIAYLPSYSSYEGNYYKYTRLIVEFNDKTYANIEVEYEEE